MGSFEDAAERLKGFYEKHGAWNEARGERWGRWRELVPTVVHELNAVVAEAGQLRPSLDVQDDGIQILMRFGAQPGPRIDANSVDVWVGASLLLRPRFDGRVEAFFSPFYFKEEGAPSAERFGLFEPEELNGADAVGRLVEAFVTYADRSAHGDA